MIWFNYVSHFYKVLLRFFLFVGSVLLTYFCTITWIHLPRFSSYNKTLTFTECLNTQMGDSIMVFFKLYSRLSSSRSSPRPIWESPLTATPLIFVALLVNDIPSSSNSSPVSSEYAYLHVPHQYNNTFINMYFPYSVK